MKYVPMPGWRLHIIRSAGEASEELTTVYGKNLTWVMLGHDGSEVDEA